MDRTSETSWLLPTMILKLKSSSLIPLARKLWNSGLEVPPKLHILLRYLRSFGLVAFATVLMLSSCHSETEIRTWLCPVLFLEIAVKSKVSKVSTMDSLYSIISGCLEPTCWIDFQTWLLMANSNHRSNLTNNVSLFNLALFQSQEPLFVYLQSLISSTQWKLH